MPKITPAIRQAIIADLALGVAQEKTAARLKISRQSTITARLLFILPGWNYLHFSYPHFAQCSCGFRGIWLSHMKIILARMLALAYLLIMRNEYKLTEAQIKATVAKMNMTDEYKRILIQKAVAGDQGARFIVYGQFKRQS